jgi:hypothetical protein
MKNIQLKIILKIHTNFCFLLSYLLVIFHDFLVVMIAEKKPILRHSV